MKISVAKDTIAATQTVNLSDSLRDMNVMDSYGFKPVSFWVGRGLARLNYCGQGYDGYNSCCIPCNISFSGRSTKVTVKTKVFASNKNIRTFRWAIIPYDFDYLFLGVGRADNSSGLILNQGTFTVDYANRSVHTETFTFPVQNLPSGKFYIYWWRDSDSYGNIHIADDFTVTVYKETGALTWYNATPYVWQDGSGWKRATPYIRKKNSVTGQLEWAQG